MTDAFRNANGEKRTKACICKSGTLFGLQQSFYCILSVIKLT